MIIYLDQSKIFTKDPAKRFAKYYDVAPALYRQLYGRYVLSGDYDSEILCGYFQNKTGKKLSKKALYRWMFRGKIYSKVKPIRKMGVRAISSSFFGELESEVINEFIKNIRFGKKQDSRTII